MRDPLTVETFIARQGYIVSIGSEERGLALDDALAALKLASEEGRAILGGDVYVALAGDIVPAYANWHVDPEAGETYVAFRERSVRESAEYIRRYPQPTSGTPLFVLVTGPSR